MTATAYLNDLNQRYLAIHRAKEEFFWETYMGISDDHDGSTQAETAWNKFLSAAAQIAEVKRQIKQAELIADSEEKQQTLTGLNGWLATFQAHAIESEQSQQLKAELIKFEADLFEKKQNHVLTYVDEQGQQVEGSLPVLAAAVRTNENEEVRRSAHQAFLDLEQWLLNIGFLELVNRIQIRPEHIDQLGPIFSRCRPPLTCDATERDTFDAHTFQPARSEQTDEAVAATAVADDYRGLCRVREVLERVRHLRRTPSSNQP